MRVMGLRKLMAFIIGWFCLYILPQAHANYQQPSTELTEMVEAQLTPHIRLSPNQQWLLLAKPQPLANLKHLAKRKLTIAGQTIYPENFSRAQPKAIYNELSIKHLNNSQAITINDLPTGRILFPAWSPDSSHISFIIETAEQANLYLYHIAKQRLQKVAEPLNSVLIKKPYQWLADSSGVLVLLGVNIQKSPPVAKAQPLAPMVLSNANNKLNAKPDLALTKALFEFYGYSQLAKVTIDSKVQFIGHPGLIKSFNSSPNTKYILIAQIKLLTFDVSPFLKYEVNWAVWDLQGQSLRTIGASAFKKNTEHDVPTGPRKIIWRADKPATLFWPQQLEQAPFQDQLYILPAPFKAKPQLFRTLKNRYHNLTWGTDQIALLIEKRDTDKQLISTIINPMVPSQSIILEHATYHQDYRDHKRFVKQYNELQQKVLKVTGERYLFLRGNGPSAAGQIPYLDQYDVKTNSIRRLWQSEPPYYERVLDMLDNSGQLLLTMRESKKQQPNLFIRDLKLNTLTQISQFPQPYPNNKVITKQTISYNRSDGVKLSANLYLPANFEKNNGPLPLLIWLAPDIPQTNNNSPYQFNYLKNHAVLPHLANGIAILDNPSMPILRLDQTPTRGTFIQQLVANATAAIDALIKKGITTADKIAIAGHGYGAFMAVNLLAHSPLFKAGIARNGTYNMALTPFDLSGVDKHLWAERKHYIAISPFFNAHKIQAPLLLIQGQEENKTITSTMQAKLMFHALTGLEKQTKLVLLPHEKDTYQAKESVLHTLWEQEQWLKSHLLNHTPSEQNQ